MTPLAWILIGIAVAASIAFPVGLVAIARAMGNRSKAPTDLDVDDNAQ